MAIADLESIFKKPEPRFRFGDWVEWDNEFGHNVGRIDRPWSTKAEASVTYVIGDSPPWHSMGWRPGNQPEYFRAWVPRAGAKVRVTKNPSEQFVGMVGRYDGSRADQMHEFTRLHGNVFEAYALVQETEFEPVFEEAEPLRSVYCNRVKALVNGVCPCSPCRDMRGEPRDPLERRPTESGPVEEIMVGDIPTPPAIGTTVIPRSKAWEVLARDNRSPDIVSTPVDPEAVLHWDGKFKKPIPVRVNGTVEYEFSSSAMDCQPESLGHGLIIFGDAPLPNAGSVGLMRIPSGTPERVVTGHPGLTERTAPDRTTREALRARRIAELGEMLGGKWNGRKR